MKKRSHEISLLPYCSYERAILASFVKSLRQSLYASTTNENKFYINMTIENNFLRRVKETPEPRRLKSYQIVEVKLSFSKTGSIHSEHRKAHTTGMKKIGSQ